MIRFTRRAAAVAALAALSLTGMSLAACQQNKPVQPATADEMSLGDPKAKVTVIEYASAGCPFCARFNNEIFPAFKTKYVDTGKVHYVFREMLVGQGAEMSLGAAGFMTARCAGQDKYFAVLDQIFHQQDTIYKSGDLKGGLQKIAKDNGLSDKQFEDCINNTEGLNALNARNEKANVDGVQSTPTFFVNGKKAFEGVPTAEQLDGLVQNAG